MHKDWSFGDERGIRRAAAHPYGYEPDTGAFDVTRCECGCLNDISATYCNDCGGEIEIDTNAEKEIYTNSSRNVFAVKHDDGSLEFDGKRYVIATLGAGECELHVCEGSFSAVNRPVWRCDCGAFVTQYTDTTTYHKPRYCPNCGRRVKR